MIILRTMTWMLFYFSFGMIKFHWLTQLFLFLFSTQFILFADTNRQVTLAPDRQICTKIQSILSFGKYQTYQLSSNITYVSRNYSQSFLAYSPVENILIFVEPKHQLHVYDAESIRLIVNLTTTDIVYATSATSLVSDTQRELFFLSETYVEPHFASLRICQMHFDSAEFKFEEVKCIETVLIHRETMTIKIYGFTIQRNHVGTMKSLLFISTDVGIVYTVFDTINGSLVREPLILNDTMNEGSVVVTSSGIVYYANKQENTIHEIYISRDFRLRYGKIIKSNAIKSPFGLVADECNHLYIGTKSMILVMFITKYATIRSIFSKASDVPITFERLNSTTYVYVTFRNSSRSSTAWTFNFIHFNEPDKSTTTTRVTTVNNVKDKLTSVGEYTQSLPSTTVMDLRLTTKPPLDSDTSPKHTITTDTLLAERTSDHENVPREVSFSATTISAFTSDMTPFTTELESTTKSLTFVTTPTTSPIVTIDDYKDLETVFNEQTSSSSSILSSAGEITDSSHTLTSPGTTLEVQLTTSPPQDTTQSSHSSSVITVDTDSTLPTSHPISTSIESSSLSDLTIAPLSTLIDSTTTLENQLEIITTTDAAFLTLQTSTVSIGTSDLVDLSTTDQSIVSFTPEPLLSPSEFSSTSISPSSSSPSLTQSSTISSSPSLNRIFTSESFSATTTSTLSTMPSTDLTTFSDESSSSLIPTTSYAQESTSLEFTSTTDLTTTEEISTMVDLTTTSEIDESTAATFASSTIESDTTEHTSTESFLETTSTFAPDLSTEKPTTQSTTTTTTKRKKPRRKPLLLTSTTTTTAPIVTTTTTTTTTSVWRSRLTSLNSDQDTVVVRPSAKTNSSNTLLSNGLFQSLFNSSSNSSQEKLIVFDLTNLPPSTWNLSLSTNDSVLLDIVLPPPSYSLNFNGTTNLSITNVEANRFTTNIVGVPVSLQVDEIQAKQFSLAMDLSNAQTNNTVSDVIIGRIKSEQFELNITKSDNMNIKVQQVDSETAELYFDDQFCTNESNLQINLNLSKNGTIRFGNRPPIRIGPVFSRVHMLKQSCDLEQPFVVFFDICQGHSPCMNGGTCQSDLPDYDDPSYSPKDSSPIDYKCLCPNHFSGENCQEAEYRMGYCINGGTLVERIDPLTQQTIEQCLCPLGYEGTHCETNIDDCVNIDCSRHGLCLDDLLNYTCSCYEGYYGTQCENTRVETVLLQVASKSFASVAILIIAGIAGLVVASDIHTFLTRKKKKPVCQIPKRPRAISELFENSVLLLGFGDAPIEMTDLSTVDSSYRSTVPSSSVSKPTRARSKQRRKQNQYRNLPNKGRK